MTQRDFMLKKPFIFYNLIFLISKFILKKMHYNEENLL